MKSALPTLVIGAVALAGVASTALAQTMDEHKIVSPDKIEWGPGSAALPPGAEAALLFGDPTKEELYANRVKYPAGYSIPPHTHPIREVITVLSGTFGLGMGETADRSKVQPLPAGSFFVLPPGTAHYVFIDEETIIQQNTIGPSGITYINPEDDPRKKQ